MTKYEISNMNMKMNNMFKNMKIGRVIYNWKHIIKPNKGEITNDDVIDIMGGDINNISYLCNNVHISRINIATTKSHDVEKRTRRQIREQNR